jgi:hypothetical protein
VVSDPDAGVVEVNPLTALLTEMRRQDARLGFGRAARAVKRYFGVPWWADLGQNLRDGPGWFNVRAYLYDVGRYGSIDRLNRALAQSILGAASGSRQAPQPPSFASAAEAGGPSAGTVTARAAVFGLTAKELVVKVFKFLGGTVLGTGAHAVVGGVFGGLLELAKRAGVDLPKSEFEQTSQQLSDLSDQLTRLEGQVTSLGQSLANSDVSRLLHQSDDVTSKIDHAEEDMAFLASMSPDNPTRKQFAQDLINYIGNNLLDAPSHFNKQLNPAFAIAGNPIKATSHALATSSRFFDARQSNEVRAVYDYYATYQAQLAMLLTNYWNTKPETYDVEVRKAKIAKLEASVTKTQEESLKPTVPRGTFFDTKTPQFMWGTENQTANARKLLDQKLQTRNTIRMGSFNNYQMPAAEDLRNLLEGAAGNPRAWLQAQISVSLAHQLWWVSHSVTTQRAGIKSAVCTVKVTVFDLATGRLEQHGYGNSAYSERVPDCRLNDSKSTRFLESKSGGLLLLRYLAPGESYWW